jgi:lysophospholipase L1-like esterase
MFPNWSGMKYKKEILLLIISSSFAIIFTVALGEIYFWFKNKSNWTTNGAIHDKEFGWVLTPNNTFKTHGQVSTINSLGFRSPEIDSSQRHVIIVGDSVAFGLGLSDQETLSHYLAKKLKKFQVLNFSVPGYSVGQYYLTLKKHINKTNPALVVVVIFTGNDLEETRKDNMHGIGKPWFQIKDSSTKFINESTSRYSCTNLLSRSWTIGILGLKNIVGKICKNSEYDGTNAIIQMEKILLKIQKLVTSKNASLLFVLSPTIYDYYQEGLNCSNQEKQDTCLTLRKNMQKMLLTKAKNIRENQKKHLFRTIDGMKAFRDMSLSIKKAIQNVNLPHLDMITLNTKIKRSVVNDYNEEDPFHLSSTGNIHLTEVIEASIKLNGEKISLKQNRFDSLIAVQ